MNILKKLRRWYASHTDGYTGGLVHRGDFRVLYPEGVYTRWLTYGDCKNLKKIHGGKIEWRYD